MEPVANVLDPRPRSKLTARVRRDVLVDKTMLRLVAGRARQGPDPDQVAQNDDDVTRALPLFAERGWADDPASYHALPPVPTGVRTSERRSGRRRFETVTWADGFECRPEEPGAERYASYSWNRIARATLLEHRSGDRPWLVCVHGFGMGSPSIDLRAFRAQHHYDELGLNVAFPVLPFHGRRKPPRTIMAGMPGLDVLDNLHGLAQSVWDVRQLLLLLRQRTDQPIGVMGLSLGGLVTATLASLDELHAALLLVPAVDLPTLMDEAADRLGEVDESRAERVERSRPLLRPVSPLALTPRVPTDRRFIVAGTLDQFSRPSTQAVALWRHWEEPEIHWYHGGHVSLFWARGVEAAIDATLRRCGLDFPGGPEAVG